MRNKTPAAREKGVGSKKACEEEELATKKAEQELLEAEEAAEKVLGQKQLECELICNV